jgi:hypothetical protein
MIADGRAPETAWRRVARKRYAACVISGSLQTPLKSIFDAAIGL